MAFSDSSNKVPPKAITQYLEKYAEEESRSLSNFPTLDIHHQLVIPCFRESSDFLLNFFEAPFVHQKVLCIIVINQPSDFTGDDNQQLWDAFQGKNLLWQHEHLFLFAENHALLKADDNGSYLHYLVVDRFREERTLPPNEGVGLARKIGCDIAAALWARIPNISPWIYTTDADAHLPKHYFDPLNVPSETSAVVFSTVHEALQDCNLAVLAATQIYEKALQYYVDGLQWAGSPYAFPTIGSAIAMNVQAYCEARGFPKKSGGEDFYLLNKLAKLRGGVTWIKDRTITLQARLSNRAPFGTGPAVQKILDLPDPETFPYYSPKTFEALKTWLSHIPTIWEKFQSGSDPLAPLPLFIREALLESGIEKLWPHIQKQARSQHACTTAVHHWFDAFQTLKFIRRLQQHHYPAEPLLAHLQSTTVFWNSKEC